MKWILLLIIISPAFSLAEFQIADEAAQSEETIIEAQFFSNLDLEDPQFSSPKSAREIAQMTYESTYQADLNGSLSVLKEVPYSQLWLTRHTVRLRVLNQLEAKESKAQPAN